MDAVQSLSLLPLSSPQSGTAPVVRRTSNYKPTLWDYRFIQSLPPNPVRYDASIKQRIEDLKEDVKEMLMRANDVLQKLKIVDDINRLGLAYHFSKEIQEIIQHLYDHDDANEDLQVVSIRFRLLRHEGYYVPPDVFNKFKDNEGKFEQSLKNDIRGLLSLYEASHHGLPGEHILDEALAFTTEQLKSMCNQLTPILAKHVEHSLELPLHRRMPILETRYYISFYEKYDERNSSILELAKLDFNLVQSLHQSEIKEVSSWWKDLDLAFKLPFARDRVVECYTWGVDVNFLPQFTSGRKALAKSINLISLMDDSYDIYGTLEELELFTEAIDKFDMWNIEAMDQLPEYLKLLYLAIYNNVHEIEYLHLRARGSSAMYYLRKAWGDLSKAYMLEARWFYEGYVPSMEEYMKNATISAGGYLITLVAALGMGNMVTTDAFDYIVNQSKLAQLSCVVGRLTDDLASSKDEQERGDVAKSIQCYMKEHDISEEEARMAIMDLIDEVWKDINRELLKHNPLCKPLIEGILNFGRVCEMYYQHGKDGYSSSQLWTKDRINLMYFEPILM